MYRFGFEAYLRYACQTRPRLSLHGLVLPPPFQTVEFRGQDNEPD